jgi:hypothetical protein
MSHVGEMIIGLTDDNGDVPPAVPAHLLAQATEFSPFSPHILVITGSGKLTIPSS